MSDGMTALERNIERFEALIEEMKEATREAHSVLKQLRIQHREDEKYLSTRGKEMVEQEVERVVKTELDKIGPQVREQSSLIYARVQREIDKLIDIALGKEFSIIHNREDLRPALAVKLREWILEVIETGETNG